MKKNYKYKIKGDYEFTQTVATKAELAKARKEAKMIMKKKPEETALRSCWVCNAAHYHFLQGKWKDWVLCCFVCGHYYYNRIDITEL